ncbi:MAG: IS1 family transposase, partial [Gemmatimonadales bacterium]
MYKLSPETRVMVLRWLTDRMGVRAVGRLTGASRGAILRLLAEAGSFAAFYQDRVFRNLRTSRVEADEIWSFVGAKQKNAKQPGHGDLWTFCAIDAESKLVFSWLVGARSRESTESFIADVASRLAGRIQLSTDAWGAYLTGVRKAFAFARVDYAQIAKVFASPVDPSAPGRYSPPVCIGCVRQRMIGRPRPELVST